MSLGDRPFSYHPIRALLAFVLALCVGAGTLVHAQQPAQPAPGGWQADTKQERDKAPPAPSVPRGTLPPANTTIIPRSVPETKTQGNLGELQLEALLTDDGQRIAQGLVWHVFEDKPAAPGATPPAKPHLVGSWKEAAPKLQLPPGNYFVTSTFGKAHLTRRIAVKQGPNPPQRFVLNAGGLRIAAVLATGEAILEMALSYDIYSGEADQSGSRVKVLGGVKPGLIIRLNAGIYQIVSTYGDVNSIVRADVTVEAGKLTEATVSHHAAKVTFKLVQRAGGEALADTRWTIQSVQGDKIHEGRGAIPSHILAAGAYEVIAQHGDQAYKRSFVVAAGPPIQIEIVVPQAGR